MRITDVKVVEAPLGAEMANAVIDEGRVALSKAPWIGIEQKAALRTLFSEHFS